MRRSYPDHPFLRGYYEPWPMEGDIYDLAVEGELPRELLGTLFRIGPNPQYAPRGRYHLFDGDGMVHAFQFELGRVHYRNRWVRTERFRREREAGEALFGGLFDPKTSDPRVAGASVFEQNVANTNIVDHGGNLLALWEGGKPYKLHEQTLDTVGVWDFEGQLDGPMTAHPKIDPETGEMLMFGYSSSPPYLRYHAVDAQGTLVRSEDIDAPFPSMMHDFLVTRDHIIFPVFPVCLSAPDSANPGSMLTWEPDRGTHLGVMPRAGSNRDITWLQIEPGYMFHAMNAFSEDGRVIADVCRYPSMPGLVSGPEAAPPLLTRWDIDLTAGVVTNTTLDDRPAEFPRIDDRFAGLPYRHGYARGLARPNSTDRREGDTILHYDLVRGQCCVRDLPPGDVPSEPVFVPRISTPGERRRTHLLEGDGFLLMTVYRAAVHRSDLVILDAQNIDCEPVATVTLPHRIPYGFHGNWRPASISE